MNVVDSSGWLEYFVNGHNSSFFAAAIEDVEHLIVPAITLYEVFKRVYQQRSENDALEVIAHMQHGTVIDIDMSLALEAARIAADEKLPMADSLILATAQHYQATLWTQDIDLQRFPNVQYIAK